MKAEIIAVGTELLMGYTVNTNASWLSQSLLKIGIGTYYQQVVGDNQDRLLQAIKLAHSRSDLVIITGGLGPTKDDITKQTVAQFVGKPLVQNKEQEQKIRSYYQRRGYVYDIHDANQGAMLQDSHVFFNHVGLACGFGVNLETADNTPKAILVLPGPPFELKEMYKKDAEPYILNLFHSDTVIDSLYLNFYGRGEAMISKDLADLIDAQDNPTIALYAKPNRVTIRLTANGQSHAEAEALNQQLAKNIIDRLAPYFIGFGEQMTLEENVLTLLKQHHHTLSVAESLTGGHVMNQLTKIPGASESLYGGFVTYQTIAKENLLSIDAQLIETEGVVSESTAKEMAEKTREITQTNFALALTGVAGPDPVDDKKPGDVYIALAIKDEPTVVQFISVPDKPRDIVQESAKDAALNLLRDYYQKQNTEQMFSF